MKQEELPSFAETYGSDYRQIAAALAAALAAGAVAALKGSEAQDNEGEEPEPQEA